MTPLEAIEDHLTEIKQLVGHPSVLRHVDEALVVVRGVKGPTTAQAEVLAYIRAYYRIQRMMPTYQEIAWGTGRRNKSSVHRLVHGLEARGLIRLDGTDRGIILIGAL